MDARLADGGHEVCVANPAWHDVHVKMVCDSGSGGASQVHADVESVGAVDFTHRRLAALRQIHHLVRGFFRCGCEFSDVRVRHDHRVAADVGVDVEDKKIVCGAMDDELALVVCIALQHRAEDTGGRRLSLLIA